MKRVYHKVDPRDFRKSKEELKKDLEKAVQEENYEKAAHLRDLIKEK